MTEKEKMLIDEIESYGPFDAIVVEGYDGVGKGRVLEVLSDHFGVVPYRPDYNLWQQFDHRKIDRWKVSGFFWDVFSYFHQTSGAKAMLFDRGMLSGAVYNNDMTIADNYQRIIRDMRILNILVECSEEDYAMFNAIRDSDTALDYSDYLNITNRYHEAISRSGAEYISYVNQYNDDVALGREDSCKGCGHYNHGWCRHPKINRQVPGENYRCSYSNDKEVQDYDTEVYSL